MTGRNSRLLSTLVSGLLLSGVLAESAHATSTATGGWGVAAPITVDFTVSPDSTHVGGEVTLTATLINNTSSVTSGALGIENPDYANQHITAVSPGCRNVIRTIYCGDPQLAPGATMTLTVTLVATAAGTDQFTVYGRITDVNDIYAYGSLSVS